MGEKVKETILKLEKESEKRLRQVYKEILQEAEPSDVSVVEHSRLSGFYKELLKMTEREIKDALRQEGVKWENSVWDEIGSKLERPAFSYCRKNRSVSLENMDVPGMMKYASSEKTDASGRYGAAGILTGAALTAVSAAVDMPKVIGVLSTTMGVALILAGGVLLLKKRNSDDGQEAVRKGQPEYSVKEITFAEILEEQRKANGAILKKWFMDLADFADAALK